MDTAGAGNTVVYTLFSRNATVVFPQGKVERIQVTRNVCLGRCR